MTKRWYEDPFWDDLLKGEGSDPGTNGITPLTVREDFDLNDFNKMIGTWNLWGISQKQQALWRKDLANIFHPSFY